MCNYAKLEDIQGKIDDYFELFRSEVLKSLSTKLQGPYDPWSSEDIQKAVPGSGGPGVYLFTNGQDQISYIGKCENCLGLRVWAHFGKAGNPPETGVSYPDMCGEWRDHCRKIYTVPLPGKYSFLAPGLESFLLGKIENEEKRTRFNRIGAFEESV